MWACERCVLKWCQKPSYPSENIVFPPKHNYMWCNLDFYCDPERVHNSLWGRKPTWASPNSKQWWLFCFFLISGESSILIGAWASDLNRFITKMFWRPSVKVFCIGDITSGRMLQGLIISTMQLHIICYLRRDFWQKLQFNNRTYLSNSPKLLIFHSFCGII